MPRGFTVQTGAGGGWPERIPTKHKTTEQRPTTAIAAVRASGEEKWERPYGKQEGFAIGISQIPKGSWIVCGKEATQFECVCATEAAIISCAATQRPTSDGL